MVAVGHRIQHCSCALIKHLATELWRLCARVVSSRQRMCIVSHEIDVNLRIRWCETTVCRLLMSNPLALLKHSSKSLIHLIFYNPEKLRKRWIKVCLASGQILGFFKIRVDSYKEINGN